MAHITFGSDDESVYITFRRDYIDPNTGETFGDPTFWSQEIPYEMIGNQDYLDEILTDAQYNDSTPAGSVVSIVL